MNRGGLVAMVAAVVLALPGAAAAKKPAPVNTSPPTISGTAGQGNTLQGANGTWTNSPTAYAYQWQRCDVGGANCVTISSANSRSYALTAQDAGFTIRLVVSATNGGGTTAAASSVTSVVVPLAPANTSLPTIGGSPVEGSSLIATTGSWTNNPTSYAYQWHRCDSSGANCNAVAGATTSSYTPGPADFGDTLRVSVSATNLGGSGWSGASTQTAVVTAPAGTVVSAYQMNPGHSGTTPDGFWSGALKRWTVSLGASVSYPLIVDSQVFVTAGDTNSSGSHLYALDANTGAIKWGPIEVGGGSPWSGLAYDAGRVFTVNQHGMMEAFDATTGLLDWSIQLPGQYLFSSPPTALGGLVYTAGAGSGGTLYAVDEHTGALVWTGSVMNGDHSSPAVSPGAVYVSYACGQTYGFVPSTGALIWHVNTACEGGGGKTPVLAGGRLYVRDAQFPGVFDAGTGTLLGTFATSGPAPAVTPSGVYDLVSGTLTPAGVTPGSLPAWSFAGDGTLSAAPLVAGNDVIVAGTSGNVYALSAETGSVVWSANAGSGVRAPDEQNVSQPLTGLAESGGLLVVPAGNTLVAFR